MPCLSTKTMILSASSVDPIAKPSVAYAEFDERAFFSTRKEVGRALVLNAVPVKSLTRVPF